MCNYHYKTQLGKFHKFSITQNLREIDFGTSKNAKSAISTHLGAPNFDF